MSKMTELTTESVVLIVNFILDLIKHKNFIYHGIMSCIIVGTKQLTKMKPLSLL